MIRSHATTTPKMIATKSAPLLLLLLFLATSILPVLASPIHTIVVVVMENRSFDHMLGWMKRLNPTIDGVTGSEYNHLSASDPTSPRIHFDDSAHYVDPDPGHSFQAIREQVFASDDATRQPSMSGFAQQAMGMDPSGNMSRNVMSGFRPEMVAVYQALVAEFAVFDRWFASVPASTQPNRLYVHSATSHGATSNDASMLIRGLPQRTMFENVHDAGLSFTVYYQNIPAVLFYRNLRKIKYVTRFRSYDTAFKADAAAGRLPNYAVIEQRYVDTRERPATDDHPSHDVYQGQLFIKEVYETLRASPQWNQTLLIITYDEHGGFYDHVPTPTVGVPNPDGVVGGDPFYFQFDRLGVRVPTIMVSPWIEKGTVVHGPGGVPFPTSEFEHSSIPATVKKILDLPYPFLTRRDAWAGTFEGILQTRSEPRTDCPVRLPVPLRVRMGEANESAMLSEFQQELVQLASVLNGDHSMGDFAGRVIKRMTVGEGQRYLEKAVRDFFRAGYDAKRLGADEEQLVQMRPSLTARPPSSSSSSDPPPLQP